MCSICLEDIKDKRKCKQTECGHQYHKKCLNKWLTFGNTCPYCRHELKPKHRAFREIFINTQLIPLIEYDLFTNNEFSQQEERRFLLLES